MTSGFQKIILVFLRKLMIFILNDLPSSNIQGPVVESPINNSTKLTQGLLLTEPIAEQGLTQDHYLSGLEQPGLGEKLYYKYRLNFAFNVL